MKTAALATTLFLLGTGASLAGAGAPVPEGSQTPPPSGRPSAALDDAKCEGVWKMAAPSGDTLDKDKAVPFVVNFQMVDTTITARSLKSSSRPDVPRGGYRKPTPQRSRT